jgi:hypothetical protein
MRDAEQDFQATMTEGRMSDLQTEVQNAQRHLDEALTKANAASTALGEARNEEVRLAKVLAEAFAAEKCAAENGKPTKKLTAAVRDAQDVARLHAYRLKRLEADAAEAQAIYADPRVDLYDAANVFEAALDGAAAAKQEYLRKLSAVRGLSDEHAVVDFEQGNVDRVVLQVVVSRLLERELHTGKDHMGRPILSAADIHQQFGVQRMPLIRG